MDWRGQGREEQERGGEEAKSKNAGTGSTREKAPPEAEPFKINILPR